MHFLTALAKDIIDQAWTLLGMVIAWLVLEGSARDLTGNLILITLLIWIITFPMRYEKEEEEENLEGYNPNAKDGDKDGIVQDGTPFARPKDTKLSLKEQKTALAKKSKK
jgi:hypothetical protein